MMNENKHSDLMSIHKSAQVIMTTSFTNNTPSKHTHIHAQQLPFDVSGNCYNFEVNGVPGE